MLVREHEGARSDRAGELPPGRGWALLGRREELEGAFWGRTWIELRSLALIPRLWEAVAQTRPVCAALSGGWKRLGLAGRLPGG